MVDIIESFAEAARIWIGGEWSTWFGKSALDLNGCTAAEAKTAAAEAVGTALAEEWRAAALWLERLESLAEQAEIHASHAVEAAKLGEWSKAVNHARMSRSIEFGSSRPLHRNGRLTWGAFCKTVEAAAGVSAGSCCGSCG